MEIIRQLRPWQWVKNLFIFLPMFFAGRIGDGQCWSQLLPAFVAMCLVSSFIYCINDIVDVNEDRKHPSKCRRPLAQGKISVAQAVVLAVAVLALGIVTTALLLPQGVLGLIIGYVVLNLLYCFVLKKIAIVDVMCIGVGFVLRLFVGGLAGDIWISQWLVCLTFLLTIFLAFAKRRDDVVLSRTADGPVRESAKGYNLAFMNQVIGLLGAITIVCYILYTVQPDVEERFGSHRIYLTAIFVLAGILRYLQIALVNEKSGEPSKVLLRDHPLQLCIVLWIISYAIIIYL